MTDVSNLQRGDMVLASKNLQGGVQAGTLGVVFNENGFYPDIDDGFVEVRWFTGQAFMVGNDDIHLPEED
jgi:hypothetical protein